MIEKIIAKFTYFKVLLTVFILIFLTYQNQIIAKENKNSNKTGSKLSSDLLWCGSSDNNTYLDFCFSKEKICKNFALKRRETNGGKLILCRPTKIK